MMSSGKAIDSLHADLRDKELIVERLNNEIANLQE